MVSAGESGPWIASFAIIAWPSYLLSAAIAAEQAREDIGEKHDDRLGCLDSLSRPGELVSLL